MSSLEELRQSYKPETVRVLFVGESHPAGGTFFYKADSKLFRYTLEAFSEVYGHSCPEGAAFLSFFQQLGCYLDDLYLEPVNHLSREERRRCREAGVPSLRQRVEEIQPQAVVVVMCAIMPYVERALRAMTVPLYSLPFPVRGHQRRYIEELITVLRELQEKGVLPERP